MKQIPHHRKKIMRGLGALAAGALVVLLSADAGAFECANVKLPSNLVICSDPDLMRIADERQQVYGEAWARLDADQREALKADQNRWVREYATACGVPPDLPPHLPPTPAVIQCFKQAGFVRIAILRGYPATGTGLHSPGVTSAGTRMPTQDRIGPSFKCAPGQDPLAELICSDSDLSLIDLVFVQAYQALRQQFDGQSFPDPRARA